VRQVVALLHSTSILGRPGTSHGTGAICKIPNVYRPWDDGTAPAHYATPPPPPRRSLAAERGPSARFHISAFIFQLSLSCYRISSGVLIFNLPSAICHLPFPARGRIRFSAFCFQFSAFCSQSVVSGQWSVVLWSHLPASIFPGLQTVRVPYGLPYGFDLQKSPSTLISYGFTT